MKNQFKIKSSIRYCELKQYKKQFEKNEISAINFKMSLNSTTFQATLKYGLVPARLKYDRKNKYKIYIDGITSDVKKKKTILDLQDMPNNKLLLIMEILFAKEKEEVIMLDNGDLEYHFTFVQY